MARIDLPPGTASVQSTVPERFAATAGDRSEYARVLQYRPDMAAGVSALTRAVEGSSLPPRLHELVRLRIAQINACPT